MQMKKKKRNRILSGILSLTMVCSLFTGINGLTVEAAENVQAEKTLICEKEEHIHTEGCYEQGKLICTQEESEGHQHDDSCYEETLICDNTEEGHEHTADCYEKTLTSDKEESEGHTHTSDCYEKTLICDKEEHIHTEDCYDSTQSEPSTETEPTEETTEELDQQAIADVKALFEVLPTADTIDEMTDEEKADAKIAVEEAFASFDKLTSSEQEAFKTDNAELYQNALDLKNILVTDNKSTINEENIQHFITNLQSFIDKAVEYGWSDTFTEEEASAWANDAENLTVEKSKELSELSIAAWDIYYDELTEDEQAYIDENNAELMMQAVAIGDALNGQVREQATYTYSVGSSFSYTYNGCTLWYTVTDTNSNTVSVGTAGAASVQGNSSPSKGIYNYNDQYNHHKAMIQQESIDIPSEVIGENGIKYKVTAVVDYALTTCYQKAISNKPYSYWYGLSDSSKVSDYKSGTFVAPQYKSVNIPDSVTVIGERAFYYAELLEKVENANGIVVIGICAFYNCSALESISIPNSCTSIENYAFSSCSKLPSISIPNNSTVIGNHAFYNCGELQSISINCSSIGNFSFAWCDSAKTVIINGSDLTIGEQAFYNMASLENVTITTTGTATVGKWAFCMYKYSGGKAEQYTDLVLNGNFNWLVDTEAHEGAFADKKIGSISGTISSIGEDVFNACYFKDNTVTIPSTIKSLGKNSFAAKELTTVYAMNSAAPTAGETIFGTAGTNLKIYVPCQGGYETASGWSTYKGNMYLEHGHSLPQAAGAVAATCVEKGHEAGCFCDVCQNNFKNTSDILSVATPLSDATTNNVTKYGATQAATTDKLEHSYTYKVTEDNVITESCDRGCEHSFKVTLAANDADFTGSAYAGATLKKDSDFVANVKDIYYEGTGTTNYEKSTTAPTNAGTYKAAITVDGKTAAAEFKISPKPVTATVTAENKDYDGSVKAVVTATVDTGIPGETLNISGLTGIFEDANAKEAKKVTVNASNVAYEGTVASNYAVTIAEEVTASITARPITISGITAEGKAYDSTTAAKLDYSKAVFGNIVKGETLTVTATGTFEDANAGTGKKVAITHITLGDNALKNYALAQDGQQTETAADITAKNITVTITPNGGTFAGSITEATAVLSGVEAADKDKVPVTLTYTGTTNDGTTVYNGTEVPDQAGSYTVTATIGNRNYKLIGTAFAAFVVDKAAAGLAVNPVADKTYGEADFDLDVTKNSDGTLSYASSREDVLTVDENGSVHIAGAGQAEITVAVAETANYMPGSQKLTVTVKKKNGTLTVTKLTYDVTYGDASFKIGDITSEGESEVRFGSSDEKAAAVDKDGNVTVIGAGKATITLAMAESDNYNRTDTTVVVNVAPKEITVTADDRSKIYGDADSELTYTAAGLVGADRLADITAAREAGEDVGTYEIALAKKDASNPNYAITLKTGVYTIEQRDIAGAAVSLGSALTANGRVQSQGIESVTVKNGAGEDLVVTYDVTGNQGTEAGSYTCIITGNKNYKGSITQAFVIAPGAESEVKVNAAGEVVIGSGTIGFVVETDGRAPVSELKTDKAAMLHMLVENGDLTSDELAMVADGATIDIILKVTDASDTISADSKKQIENAADKYTIGQYIDISLFKQIIHNGQKGDMTRLATTGDQLQITIRVPEALLNTSNKVTRTFFIVRNHEGRVEFLPTTYEDSSHTLSFSTDKFSDYAIVYQDSRNKSHSSSGSSDSGALNTATGTSPATGDFSNDILWVLMLLASAAAMAVLGMRRRGARDI